MGSKQLVMDEIAAGTELSKACDAYVDVLEKQQELMEHKNKAATALIESMKGAGKGQVRHRGRTLIIEEIDAQIKIKVTKSTENKKQ